MVRYTHFSREVLVASVFDKFGGIRPMARKLGDLPTSTVMSWQRSRNIPTWRHQSILEAAKRLGIALEPQELTNLQPDTPVPTGQTDGCGASA